ncbi:AEC family transporter [Planomonospora sp. ID67723]|uniref:AEC family transporter n=1 Tax=Planomonospora sp. ID67723 TaxID=2738134 RepID=UPI0018C3D21A|nr:AEC family transporter [Planomonospora sp. ID67723]MBG0826996.1 AEC family transporter [Planomonospora sp. ID67723]
MSEVVGAFAVLVAVAVLGYLAGVGGALRPQDELVLSRLAFMVATPALLFTTIAAADLRSIFSPVLVTNLAGVLFAQTVFLVVGGLVWRRERSELVIGTLSASYVNAGNLGIPVSVYVLGDGALIAPILLTQLLVMAPVAFLLLDRDTSGMTSVREVLSRPLRNPLTVATLLGLGVALTGVRLPVMLMRPIELVGAAAVPVALIAYGLSLSGARQIEEDGHARDVVLAVALKCFAQPGVAYLVGRFALGLDGGILFAATLLAALPTAQNIYVYAVHYGTAKRLARRAVLISTLISIPMMTAISGLLG